MTATLLIVSEERAAEIEAIEGLPEEAVAILLALAEKLCIFEAAAKSLAGQEAYVIAKAYRHAADESYRAALIVAREAVAR
jgi:uncharacterized protein YpmB